MEICAMFKKIHTDKRGEIYATDDILKDGREINIMTLKAGYARGGCIHRKNAEYFAVLEGEVHLVIWMPGSENVVGSYRPTPGHIIKIMPNHPHYFEAISDAVVSEWGVGREETGRDLAMRKIVEKINEEHPANGT